MPYMKFSAFFLALFALGATLFADTNATLAGRISDPNGAVIPKAKVDVTNSETNAKRSTESNSEGLYVLADLPPGKYQVQVAAQGFETLIHDGVMLRVQDIVTQNYSMKIGAVATSVTVESGASMVTTDSGAVGTVIDRRFVENMPLNGRSFQSLIFLTPGVALAATSATSQGQFSVNGQRANSNYFTVDGVSANFAASGSTSLGSGFNGSLPGFNASGGTNGLVSVDALQEFRIQTSSFSAENGRSPGAQIAIVTRSGTNQFHGSAFDYFRNDILDANNWFANRDRTGHPALRQHDFGGVLGGPVEFPGYNGHDRTFFFISYEQLMLRQPQTLSILVPSNELRAQVLPNFRALLNAYPLPTGSDLGSGFAPFATSFSNPSTLRAGSVRLDHTIGKGSQIFFRYNQSPQTLQTRNALNPSNVVLTDNSIRTITGGITNSFRPTLTNDFRVNYSSNSFVASNDIDGFHGAVRPSDSLLFPGYANGSPARTTVALSLPAQSGSFTVGDGQSNIARQFNAVETLSWSKGNHLMKFGVDYRRTFPIYTPSVYAFTVSVTSMANLLAQNVSSESISVATEVFPIYMNLSAFATDTWRATPRLTLTYGVRWEVNPAPTEANGRSPLMLADVTNLTGSGLAPAGTPIFTTKYHDFAPRFGFAYQLRRQNGSQTVLRGGSGIFYDLGNSAAALGLQAYPYVLTRTATSAPFPLTATQLAVPVPVAAPPYPGSGVSYDQKADLPYTIQWNVALEQALGNSQTFSLTYTGALGRRLPFLATYVSLLGGPKNPNFTTGYQIVRNILTSDYHGLQGQYTRRLAHGLQALASYTWSHAIDEQSDEATGVIRRGDSIFDRRQAFKGSLSYDIPGIRRNEFAKSMTSGWSFDAMVYAVSAPPFDYKASTVFAPDGTPIAQSVNLLPGVSPYISDPNAPGGKRLNGAAFGTPAAGTVGTLGRNSLRAFPLSQADVSIRREFHIRERLRLQARLDSFNVLNHPNFGGFNIAPARTLPTFGLATTMYGQSLGTGGGVGGYNPLYQLGGPRTHQLSLKLVF